MPSGKSSLLVVSFFLSTLFFAVLSEPGRAFSQSPAQSYAGEPSQKPVTPPGLGIPEEVPDEELAPAEVQLDVSKTSPLIQALYQATRETKEEAILAQLEQAKTLIA